MREDVRYAYTDFAQASEDRGTSFKIGEVFELRLRLFAFDAPQLTTLFDRFVEIRQDLTGPGVIQHELPFSAAWTIAEEKYNRDNWVEKYQFYSVSIDGVWQIGWVGGIMSTYPLLMLGHEQSVGRARKTFDFLFNGGQSEFGIFYGFGDGQRWYGDDFADPDDKNVHLIRNQADAVYFLLKQLDLMEKQGMAIEARWDEGVRKATDALTAIWTRNGQFGQFVDAENGDILIGGSTSAAIAPAGLALAYQRYGNPAYLEFAMESAQVFYDRDVLAGVTTGAPGEILQAPDSESAFGLLESFVVLYEVTNDRQWIDKAEDIAAQCSTWTVSYDWPFPADTTFGKLGIHSSGAVWANVQNKHGAPAICTLSGDSLWKLFRATGNRYYLDVLRDTAHNLTQYISRSDRPIDGMPSGWVNERVNLSDWDNNIGGVFRGSCWPLEALMITVAEVPGIYVQIDTGLVVVFDHLDIQTLVIDGTGITLQITNPTAFLANVRLFAETSSQASRSLGQNSLVNRPTIDVRAGETRHLVIAPDGSHRLF